MRKNDLIKKLESIKGNPDIKLWNGFVGDWQEIGEITASDVVKQTFEDWCLRVKHERIRDTKNKDFQFDEVELKELRSLYRSHEWDFNRYVTQEDVKKGYYKRKTIFLIEPKTRNKKSWDRMGDIEY